MYQQYDDLDKAAAGICADCGDGPADGESLDLWIEGGSEGVVETTRLCAFCWDRRWEEIGLLHLQIINNLQPGWIDGRPVWIYRDAAGNFHIWKREE